jgi:4-cresol dehydrogenase (hydroxylating)
MAMAGIYGPKAFVDVSRDLVEKALSPFATLLFTDPREGPLGPHAGALLRAFGLPDQRDEEMEKLAERIIARLQAFANLHRGVPFDKEVVLITPHPGIDDATLPQFGHYTYGPTCPATGRDAQEFVSFIGSIVKPYGFRYTGSSFAFINPRTLVSVAHIVFDRSDPESMRKAKECVDVIVRESFAKGYPPYRVGIQSMNDIDPERSGYWKTVRRLKAALDPDAIFAPGRYLPE